MRPNDAKVEQSERDRESLWSWFARFARQCLLLAGIAALSIGIGLGITLGPSVLMREAPYIAASLLPKASALSAIAFVWLFALELLRRRKRRP